MKLISFKQVTLNLVLSLSILSFSHVSLSACKEANMPEFPNGDWIGEQELLAVQEEVKRYMARQEDFLNCVKKAHKHNAAIDKMTVVAKKYNTMRKRYKARLQTIDVFTELA